MCALKHFYTYIYIMAMARAGQGRPVTLDDMFRMFEERLPDMMQRVLEGMGVPTEDGIKKIMRDEVGRVLHGRQSRVQEVSLNPYN